MGIDSSAHMILGRYLYKDVVSYDLMILIILKVDRALTGRIRFDAEALELHLPDDRRIHIKNVKDLAVVATKLGKPINHQFVDGNLIQQDLIAGKRTIQVLVVYDGTLVYDAEVQKETAEGEERSKCLLSFF